MALVSQSTYNPHLLFKSKHLNTIYRTLFHKIEVVFQRERMETSDGDFMDLDFSHVDSDRLVIIIHGLEGSSGSKYVTAMTQVANLSGYDVLAVNLRGCSGETNRLLYSYHSGKTNDFAEILRYLDSRKTYKSYFAVGYSLGGNLLLKYLGEQRDDYSGKLQAGVGVSVPCDLKGSSEAIAKFWNMVYMQRFLISLKKKTRIKMEQFPENGLNTKAILNSANFLDFDNYFTAPVNGFMDANDYWKQNSSKQFLGGIKIPSLLITAADDPFLSETCIPVQEAKNNRNFKLEVTRYGGHVGYNSTFENGSGFWLEKRIMKFFAEV
ncbi:alpha/beta fold hydrolase [Lutimonas saemankumensis]|uniref:YheT family hydrolase n=1 Tax=Lutimonas saemankumensis TaxID=483016 RepID=UPI001CD7E25A|nr:alpha/beta fold hydrolase [Lutimonas saemankumensis]MCA0931607.1 alpha/beta fold hydrolase [Lutimonas saemankumensis]